MAKAAKFGRPPMLTIPFDYKIPFPTAFYRVLLNKSWNDTTMMAQMRKKITERVERKKRRIQDKLAGNVVRLLAFYNEPLASLLQKGPVLEKLFCLLPR